MKNAVLVLGYNNTRINDVRKIQQKANEHLDAKTVLCKKSPTIEDNAAADYVIDVDLNGDETNVEKVRGYCDQHGLNIVALLPFSDPGTQLGAALAKSLGLNGPNPEQVKSALDKGYFRQQESNAQNVPFGYKKIKSEKVTSFEQLQNLYKDFDGKVFLKPASEGNSRGCININQEENLKNAWTQVSKYLNGGIVAEELIDTGYEYSWDHVAGYSWITEKETTKNNYRAEIQQILPAPVSNATAKCISDAGMFMSDLSGSNQGACHNEIFYIVESNNVMAVEPNLRPAGMRIWDLAAIAFENFDPWKEWLLWAANKHDSTQKKLKQNYFVGIRMIQASKSGVLEKISAIDLIELSSETVDTVELTWTKKIGDSITHDVKDNSEFIGFIIAKSKDYLQLTHFLGAVCNELSNKVIIQ